MEETCVVAKSQICVEHHEHYSLHIIYHDYSLRSGSFLGISYLIYRQSWRSDF
jgi:hypothetical protein